MEYTNLLKFNNNFYKYFLHFLLNSGFRKDKKYKECI